MNLTVHFQPSEQGPFIYLGVKNLTNEDVRYPDQYTSLIGKDLIYPDDYPRPDRRYWVSLGFGF